MTKIIKRGSLTPEQRKELTCPKCSTVFIYQDREVWTEKGKPQEDKLGRFWVTAYPDAFAYVKCPLRYCNTKVFVKALSNYEVDDHGSC